MSDIYVKICADTEMTADGLVEKLKVFENLHTSKKEMDIILNTLDLELQNNKVAVLKENKKVVGLDFSEHDKVFEDKIAELENIINHKLGNWDKLGITYQEILCMKAENDLLKQRIAELESKEMENFSEIDTSNPLACAESLIEHMTHCEKFMIMPERDVQTFSVEELKEIADYLMVYYKHHKDRDVEDTISF